MPAILELEKGREREYYRLMSTKEEEAKKHLERIFGGDSFILTIGKETKVKVVVVEPEIKNKPFGSPTMIELPNTPIR